LFVLTGALLTFAGRGAPAGAIETSSYGLDVVQRTDDGRLHVAVKAGETTTGQVRVWNKEQQPITLQLSVAPAQVDKGGTVSLGGDGEGVDWVTLSPARVELAAGADQVVAVRVRPPRKIEGGQDRVVAVQVEPAASATGDQPAVVQRLALTTYLEPDSGSLIASLGPFPWIALAVLVLVAVLVGRNAVKRRGAPTRE
jgi:hypothetical protein